MKAVLIVGHGSRDFEGNEEVRQFVNNMKTTLDPSLLVETCFLELESPTIEEGIDTCVNKGADHILVIPLMLLAASHSKIHIPGAIDEAKRKYPDISFDYGRPIGIHEGTLEICKNRLEEIGEDTDHPDPDAAVVLLGRGGSDPDANSDLYKIARLLWEKLNYKMVEPAFYAVTNPSLEEVIDRYTKLGAKKIFILPYFLFTGILIKRLEKMVAAFQKQYPDHEIKLTKYLGFHPGLESIITDRIQETLVGEVKMNCDTCQYRLEVMEHIGHHHHHDHDHHDHDHHHDKHGER